MLSSCVVTEDMPVPMIDQMINRLMFTRICLRNKGSSEMTCLESRNRRKGLSTLMPRDLLHFIPQRPGPDKWRLQGLLSSIRLRPDLP